MELNWKEARILKHLVENGESTLRDISRACFPGVRPVEKADSQVRNNLRRIRDTLGGKALVKRVKRGVFVATDLAKAVNVAVAKKTAKAKPIAGSRAAVQS